MFNVNYNPDVLTCLANLSNDEVFTPPDVANKMLDQLPQELWNDKNITFLDPCTKSGIFLREITKRLLVGLEKEIPNLQDRLDHILTKQVYGIGITELTALLARRSLYCSKNANKEFSITNVFDNNDGNVLYKNIGHKWKNLKCEFCGATKDLYNRKDYLEQYAYDFIHTENPKELFNMKFDVIIGNPPYQLSDSGAGASAKPLYHKFIRNAIKMNPRYLSMIIPSRWFSGGKGLDDFRKEMINDTKMKDLVIHFNAKDCFPGIPLEGGVCYFLWDANYNGECSVKNINDNELISESKRFLKYQNNDTIIQYNEAISILDKVKNKNLKSFSTLVSSRKPFGFDTTFKNFSNKNDFDSIKIYCRGEKVNYVNKNLINKNLENVEKYKVFISRGYGYGTKGFPHQVLNTPILGDRSSCCTETYLMIGPFESKNEAENVISFIRTKLFRFLVMLKKPTQDGTSKVYNFVPILNFNKKWNNKSVYDFFKLDKNEIDIIEKMITEM